jgi:hypothetical protein
MLLKDVSDGSNHIERKVGPLSDVKEGMPTVG